MSLRETGDTQVLSMDVLVSHGHILVHGFKETELDLFESENARIRIHVEPKGKM